MPDRIRCHRVGEVSSNYGYQPELFEKDVEKHATENEALYQEFRSWMMERQVEPDKLRYMFVRLREDLLAP